MSEYTSLPARVGVSAAKVRDGYGAIRIFLVGTVLAGLTGCSAVPMTAIGVAQPSDYVEIESQVGGAPRVGLALAGGGEKSAPFAMGVLAGLQEAGLLSEVDVISSVSGGTYAALYLYERYAEEYRDGTGYEPEIVDQAFDDCLPLERKQLIDEHSVTRWNPATDVGECPYPEPSMPWRNYWNASEDALIGDPLRFASQVRASQSLFSSSWDYEGTRNLTVKVHIIGREVGLAIVNSGLLFAPSFLADSLFDWRTERFAVGKRAYNSGIQRAYGSIPAVAPHDHNVVKPVEWARPPGATQQVNFLTFTDLRTIYEQSRAPECVVKHPSACHLPLWIVNTTAGTSRGILESFGVQNFTPQMNVFELSTFGYGSGAYGYQNWGDKPTMQPTQQVTNAVAASAAFFDSQQQQEGGLLGQPLINVGLQIANFEWGTNIPNYNLERSEYQRQKIVHAFLPWPLYLFHRHRADPKVALDIHLSDGGMSENLGVWALLRRHVRYIIVVDSASDTGYGLSDPCELERHLEQLPAPSPGSTPASEAQWQQSQASIWFVGEGTKEDEWPAINARLRSFPQACKDIRDGRLKAEDPFGLARSLPAPILRARVCRGMIKACDAREAIAELFIIKPALQMTARSNSGSYALEDAMNPKRATTITQEECGLSRTSVASSTGYPCEVLSFLAIPGNFSPMIGDDTFPQNSTVRMSALSSPYLYGAYHELARYYAKAIRIRGEGDNKRVEVDMARFWRWPEAGALQ